MKNNPASIVIKELGGATAVAALLGKDQSTVSKWAQPRSQGGAEGRIPLSNIFPIWCALVRAGSGLTLDQLIFLDVEQAILVQLSEELFQPGEKTSSRKSDQNFGVD